MNVRFGGFRLDSETRQLFRGDVEVHVSPKALDLLTLLVERRPRALSKTELHEHLWPDTFVSDANLPLLIGEIRAALGDDARDSHFVRTVQRFGYAFSGSVVDVPSARATAAASDPRCWFVVDGQRIELAHGDHVLGRDPAAEVWVNVSGVSRHHARLRIVGPDATIEDLQSKNGTFVRGERISAPARLEDGDEIRLGRVSITFRVWSSGDTTDAHGD